MNLSITQLLCTLSLLAVSFAATGCGSKNDAGSGGVGGVGASGGLSSESLTYQFSLNGCDTGEHTFSSQDDYCAGLQNSALNHGCAESLRRADFRNACPGRTFTPN